MSVIVPIVALNFDPQVIVGYLSKSIPADKLPQVTPLESVIYAVFLVFVCHTIKLLVSMVSGTVNTFSPRSEKDPENKLLKRIKTYANNAQSNGWESLAIFAPGVVACVATNADMALVTSICQFYLLTRAAFNFIFIFGQGILGKNFLGSIAAMTRTPVWITNSVLATSLFRVAAEASRSA